ncbi:MAG: ABC transporter permease [Planctomycetota bacterium]
MTSARTDTAVAAARPPQGWAAWSPPARAGAAILACIVTLCVLSLPWTLARVEREGGAPVRRYEAGNLQLALLPPSWWSTPAATAAVTERERAAGNYIPSRVLGTDRLGRDLFARCLLGGAVSLLVGASAALIAVTVGTLYGALSGARGGRVDDALMRTVDVLYGLPSMLLVVLLAVAVDGVIERMGVRRAGALGQGIDLVVLLVAIGATSWLTIARVIRGQILSLRAQPFMEACRALGIGPARQFFRHALPNVAGTVAVYAALAVPAAILAESFLSFLGIGVRDPMPSWGNLASEGLSEVNTVHSRWWLLLWPCLSIAATLLALNFLGDAMRQAVDPAAAGRRRGS